MEPLVEDVAEHLAAALPRAARSTSSGVRAAAAGVGDLARARARGRAPRRRPPLDRRRDRDDRRAAGPRALAGGRARTLDFQLSLAARTGEAARPTVGRPAQRLVQAAADRRRRTGGHGELVDLTRELMVAGNESSLRLLADIVWQLDGVPRNGSGCATTGSAPGAVVEEALRLASPSARCTGGSRGHRARRRRAAGRRDPGRVAAVREPGRGGVPRQRIGSTRPPGGSTAISFGQGPHACIGNAWPGWRRATRCGRSPGTSSASGSSATAAALPAEPHRPGPRRSAGAGAPPAGS